MYAPFKPFVCAAGAHPNPFDEYYAPPFVTMCAVDVTRLLTRLPPSVSSGVCAIFHFGRTDNSIAPTKKWDLSRESQMLRHRKVLLDRARPLHISQIFLRYKERPSMSRKNISFFIKYIFNYPHKAKDTKQIGCKI
jgi:hypothetical protein